MPKLYLCLLQNQAHNEWVKLVFKTKTGKVFIASNVCNEMTSSYENLQFCEANPIFESFITFKLAENYSR